MIGQTIRYTSNDREPKPAPAVDVRANHRAIEFHLLAICDVAPDRWHGEVHFGCEVRRTETVTADPRARAMLCERILEVFSGADRSDGFQ